MSRDVCKCGHAKDTHFKSKETCLAAGDCKCVWYIDEEEEDAPETPRIPFRSPHSLRGKNQPHYMTPDCVCPACVQWRRDNFRFPF